MIQDVVLQTSHLYYPNRIARYFFDAMDDVMGQVGLNAVLTLAGLDSYVGTPPPDNLKREFDFAAMAALNIALEQTYGTRGGRGIAMRIGRACFSQGMRSFGALAGISDPAFRAKPLEECGALGLKALAHVFNTFSDQGSRVEIDQTTYRFIVNPSPVAWGRTSDKPVCHALAGIIQEAMRWASNGREYYVFETACRACGEPECVFTINKTPIA